MHALIAQVSFWDVIWWLLALFVFAMFFWLFISVLADLWQDPDASGGAKAGWTFFVVILPWLGILIYLIARGGGMAERSIAKQARQQEYIAQARSEALSDTGTADELAKLADLKDRGVLSEDEFNAQKAKLLG